MKQEFVTLYGKAVIEENTLHIRNINVPFSRTSFAKVSLEIVYVLVFVLQFFRKPGPMYYVGTIVWGALLAFRLPELYTAIIKTSYTNRIAWQHIQSISSHEQADGLHATVTLHLKSGRNRNIIFRKLENQHEVFMECVVIASQSNGLAHHGGV